MQSQKTQSHPQTQGPTSGQSQRTVAASSSTLQDRLLDALTPLLESLGYELVYLEVQTHRAKTIRVFIDHLDSTKPAIGIEDCATVSRALDEPLEKLTEGESVLTSGYELEVSSPGVDRPLRKPADFERFKEREVRLHVFRALTADELKNEDYFKRNPKQKNFLGILKGMKDGSVRLAISPTMGSTLKGKKKSKKADELALKFDDIEIPLDLVSKANIEPSFTVLDQKD